MPAEIPIITVDGPSGTGKGTVCSYLAERLGWRLLDSGAIYRVLGHAALQEGIPLADGERLAGLAGRLDLDFRQAGGGIRAILAGVDVTDAIRTESAGAAASQVAALPEVRAALLAIQRAFCRPPGLIADGRDMGTVVFPTARLKLYLTASPEERARRRYNQLKQKGIGVNLPDLSTDIRQRDARDEGRAISPSRPAPDAIVIDTTNLDAGEVCNRVVSLVQSTFHKLPLKN